MLRGRPYPTQSYHSMKKSGTVRASRADQENRQKAIDTMLDEEAYQLVAESLYERTDERELTTAVESDRAWPFYEVSLRRQST